MKHLLSSAWGINKKVGTIFLLNPLLVKKILVMSPIVLYLSGCANQSEFGSELSHPTVADLQIVDCLLPGQVRQLGSRASYITARRPVNTTAADCRIRGGEYVAYDRANLKTSLNVWMPTAQLGNAEAQANVGEIFERGLGGVPNYEAAVIWYTKAANQGNSRAQFNLGTLYEQGFGVAKSKSTALNWYRKAWGIATDTLIYQSTAQAQQSAQKVQSQQKQQMMRSQLQSEISVKNDKIAALNQKIQQVSQSSKATVQQQNSSIASAQGQVSKAKAQALAAEREKQRAQQNAQLAKDQAQQAKAKAARVKEEALQASKQAQAAADKAKRAQAQAVAQAAANSEQKALAKQQAELAIEQANQAKRQAQKLAQANKNAQQQAQALAQSNQQAQLQVSALTKANQEANVQLQKLSEENQQAHLRAREVTAQMTQTSQQKQQEIDALKAQVAALTQENKKAQQQVTQLPVFREPEINKSAGVSAGAQSNSLTAKGVKFGKYYALVIGNQSYSSLDSLSTPKRDAQQVASVLKSKYGFSVQLLLDANNIQVMKAINNLNRRLKKEDNLLIFYAGHGSRVRSGSSEEGYWLPVNAERPPADTFWVSNEFVTRHLSRIQAKRVLVVADSCYAGLLSSAPSYLFMGGDDNDSQEYLKYKLAKKSRLILSSGGDKPVLDNAGQGNSVFARAFLDVLKSNNEVLAGPQLFTQLKDRVKRGAKVVGYNQVPVFKAIKGAGHEVGDFFFVPAS